jgi:hypothetical protein
MKLMASLDHQPMLGNKRERPLLQMKLGAFLYFDVGLLCRPPEGSEDRNVGIEPDAVVAPLSSGDHSSVEVKDPL